MNENNKSRLGADLARMAIMHTPGTVGRLLKDSRSMDALQLEIEAGITYLVSHSQSYDGLRAIIVASNEKLALGTKIGCIIAQSYRCVAHSNALVSCYIDEYNERSILLDDLGDIDIAEKSLELGIAQAEKYIKGKTYHEGKCLFFIPQASYPYMSKFYDRLSRLRTKNVIMLTKYDDLQQSKALQRDLESLVVPAAMSKHYAFEQFIRHNEAFIAGDHSLFNVKGRGIYVMVGTLKEDLELALGFLKRFSEIDDFLLDESKLATDVFYDEIKNYLTSEANF